MKSADMAALLLRAEVSRVTEERDEARAEIAAVWGALGDVRAPDANTLASAVKWALQGRYSRNEMSEILGRREGERTADAARRVVAELAELRARAGR